MWIVIESLRRSSVPLDPSPVNTPLIIILLRNDYEMRFTTLIVH